MTVERAVERYGVMENEELLLFTGGYTEPILMGSGETVPGSCKGIVCWRFCPDTGRLEYRGVTEGVSNPSCVLADPHGPYLYCVNELKQYGGIEGSTVSAFAIEADEGRLRLINRQFTCGADACHMSMSPDGRYLLAANYSGGSFCVFPVREDHGLDTASCILKHHGKGADPWRQEKAHPHQTILSPDGQLVYVSDLGLDRLACYEADWERGWLLPAEEKDIKGLPGQGTRHGVFNGSGDRLYIMTEMSCEVNVYQYDRAACRGKLLQTVPALGEKLPGDGAMCLGSGIRLHPSGRWLYCAVRGTDHIAVFRMEPDGGLSLIQTEPSGGRTPRDFVISPEGRYLLAGNQDTDTIGVFKIHEESGCIEKMYMQEEAYCVTSLCFWKRQKRAGESCS